MKLFDARCEKCGRTETDVVAPRGTEIDFPCPCGGRFRWAPGFGTADVKSPFFDPHLGVTVSSFRELEKMADAKDCHLVPSKEFEGKSYKTQEERLNMNAPKRRAAVERAYYRAMNGYKD